MGVEEQREEREVLDSIFPDEITATILLNVSYPESYPDVAPNLDITNAPDAPRHPLLDLGEDKARLLDALQPAIEDSLGMAMVFTLVSTLKDAAELLISERQAAAQALKDVEAAKAEEEENRKFHGTAVTRETFLEWRERFRTEMAVKEKKEQEEREAEERKKRGGKPEDKKLTGKQLWERGLAGKVEDEDISMDDAAKAMEEVKV
ncbi:MAG: hypothetical protein Q9227_006398 [Pyrenula ochraceoflavens]